MADKMKGILKRVVKDFGFIKLVGENREIFVHQSDYPGQMTEGSRVLFEESAPDPKKNGKTHAENVEVLDRADPPAPVPAVVAAPAVPITTPVKAKAEKPFSVSWRYDDPIVQTNLILVKTYIKFLLNDGSPATDLKVSLYKVDDKGTRTDVRTPSPKATPGGNGEAYFALYFTPDVENCDLVATANGKEYSYSWSKNQPVQTALAQVPTSGTPDPTATTTTSTPAIQTPTTIEVEKSGPDANGVYTFRVVAIPNKDVTIGGSVAVEPQGPFTADDQGRVVIEVKVRDKGAKGEINFRCESLISKSRYVTSKQ